MTSRVFLLTFFLTLTLPLAVFAQPAPLPAGRSQMKFDQRDPEGLFAVMAKRFQWKISQDEYYKIEEQSFEVYQPQKPAGLPPTAGARGGKKAGLVVWINSDDSGAPPPGWLRVLDKHNLYFVGADRSGNEHPPAERFALALDAAFNMRKKFEIDENRVYLVGLSGGGKCASMLAMAYPDVFHGAVYIVGCTYFRGIELSEKPGYEWKGMFKPPPAELLKLAKERSRYVFLTGETDFNRTLCKDTRDAGYKADGFRNTEYIEVPKMGHEIPGAAWFEKAIESLDAE